MKYIISFFILLGCVNKINCQKIKTDITPKPKLVVGIVIDQMRWDYLQRFEPLFKQNGGFKRMINNGFNCNNAMVPYTPTVTACGHTCIYTGSVPNIHGIVGNDWWDKLLNKTVYCTDDKNETGIGDTKGDAGKMSPRNMLTTTIGDELRLASNFKSKVIGIAIKDRGAILPAGHSANAAYWYDKKTGSFISSSYYMNDLPNWVATFNERKLTDSFLKIGWDISLPSSTYLQYCTADKNNYESKPFGKEMTEFPYNLSQFAGQDYNKIISTPYGNNLTFEMAKAALINEKMGKNLVTDMLAISFSSPDYIGHSFGPNSWEVLDCYIKLDKELGVFLDFLDARLGKGNYISFLTSDHAVAHIPSLMQEHKIPAGTFDDNAVVKEMNLQLKKIFGLGELIVANNNYQLTIDNKKIDSAKTDKSDIIKWIITYLKSKNEVANAFELDELMETPMNKTVKEMLANGYYTNRSGDIQYILKPGFIDGMKTGTTHGLWNPYDAHIPLLWYGWGIKKGSSFNEVYMTDIAATIAALLKIQMPNGCVGKVIKEICN